MNFQDYFVNLAVFSLLVSTPLVIRSFVAPKSIDLKPNHIVWISLYTGFIAFILMHFSIQSEGFVYDIRSMQKNF
ncbi:hypothetical protein [Ammoniphilus sp. YIM 78166]|uniref:hypothetical protein n=1 Tax=Ammoniphilus sp. YIM 78166 TaxID=1644106 RepID=UPI00106F8511|nr:hypothetical protein [Ammoniphilus sp. YIM 78166]